MKTAYIVLAALLLSSCSSMEGWSSGASSGSASAMNNTTVNPAVTNNAADPKNIYFGD